MNDLEKAEAFYNLVLGFETVLKTKGQVELNTGSWPLYLKEVNGAHRTSHPKQARTSLSIQTYKLLPRIDEFRNQQVPLMDSLLARNGVGISIPFQDPSGNVLHLIEVQIRKIPVFDGLQIYNTGVTIGNMDQAIRFYKDILGFQIWSNIPNNSIGS